MYSASRPNICEHQHLLFEHCRDVAICSSSSFKNRKVDESDFRQCKKYKRWQCLSHRVWVPSEAHVRKVAPPRICTHPYDIWGRCCTPLKRKRQHHDASCQKKSKSQEAARCGFSPQHGNPCLDNGKSSPCRAASSLSHLSLDAVSFTATHECPHTHTPWCKADLQLVTKDQHGQATNECLDWGSYSGTAISKVLPIQHKQRPKSRELGSIAKLGNQYRLWLKHCKRSKSQGFACTYFVVWDSKALARIAKGNLANALNHLMAKVIESWDGQLW